MKDPRRYTSRRVNLDDSIDFHYDPRDSNAMDFAMEQAREMDTWDGSRKPRSNKSTYRQLAIGVLERMLADNPDAERDELISVVRAEVPGYAVQDGTIASLANKIRRGDGPKQGYDKRLIQRQEEAKHKAKKMVFATIEKDPEISSEDILQQVTEAFPDYAAGLDYVVEVGDMYKRMLKLREQRE